MKAEQQPSPHNKKTPEPGSRPQFLSVPVWDISDEEIDGWKHSRCGVAGVRLAGYAAAAIRDGEYDNGRELYPLGSSAYQEVTRETVDLAMGMLMERGMVRKSGGAWYPVVPGRMEPSMGRAVGTLLARRADLPPALAAELESWKRALDALNAPDGLPPAQAATVRPVRPTRPAFAVAAN